MRITVAESEEQRRIVDRAIVAGASCRRHFRLKWREVVYEMIRFCPELVIISAGFDAHKRDPLAELSLLEEDFEWATKIVMDACRACARQLRKVPPSTNADALERRHFPGAVPCISILEGGYNIDAIASSSAVHVDMLFGEATLHEMEEQALTDAEKAPVEHERNDDINLAEASTPSGLFAVEPLEDETVSERQITIAEEEREAADEAPAAAPLSIEDILAGLDVSINSLMVSALLQVDESEGDPIVDAEITSTDDPHHKIERDDKDGFGS